MDGWRCNGCRNRQPTCVTEEKAIFSWVPRICRITGIACWLSTQRSCLPRTPGSERTEAHRFHAQPRRTGWERLVRLDSRKTSRCASRTEACRAYLLAELGTVIRKQHSTEQDGVGK